MFVQPYTNQLLIPCAGIICVVASPAHAAIIRHDVADREYRSRAHQSQFQAVGKVIGRHFGSGTLISPWHVLTAAHVTDNSWSVTFQIAGQNYDAARWITHPHWNDNLYAGNDLSILQLNRPVHGVRPAALYTGNRELGRHASMVGFGGTGTGLHGVQRYDDRKRMVRNTVDGVMHRKLLWVDFDAPHTRGASTLGGSSPLALEGLSSFGDSGGGLFINDGGWKLAGVTSFGKQGVRGDRVHDNYGDQIAYVRVSPKRNWINDILRGRWYGSDNRGYLRSTWDARPLVRAHATAVPGPTSVALAALACLVAAPSRRSPTPTLISWRP